MVRRVGKRIILEPADEWSPEFLAILGSIDEEIERPKQIPITRTRNPFD
jgi:hypothetical protein